MKEIVNRLHETRQVELAKQIMEAAGYKVTKTTNESGDIESRLRSKMGKKVTGIGYYGTELANEFFELQDTDPRIEEIVSELGLEGEIWPEDEEQEPSDEVYMKVLLAYYKEKANK